MVMLKRGQAGGAQDGRLRIMMLVTLMVVLMLMLILMTMMKTRFLAAGHDEDKRKTDRLGFLMFKIAFPTMGQHMHIEPLCLDLNQHGLRINPESRTTSDTFTCCTTSTCTWARRRRPTTTILRLEMATTVVASPGAVDMVAL